jgi:glycosyltransferase involved in cell wall biosynthesis
MNRVNVWFFSPYESPKGQSSRNFNFARLLAERGHSVTMIVNGLCHRTQVDELNANETWRVEYLQGVRVIWLKTPAYQGNGLSRGINMLFNAWRSIQVSRTLIDAPDAVVGESVPPTAGLMAYFVAKQRNAKFIYQIRDVWPIALVYDGSLSKMNPIYFLFRWIEKYLYRKSFLICSTLRFLHNHVQASGSNPSKLRWIPNGVDLEPFCNFPNYGGGNDAELKAMYIGGFGAAHDVFTIVKAAQILQQKNNKHYRFIIIGDGVKKEHCIREVQKYNITNIEFRNSVARDKIPEVLQEADILIASVLDSEAYKFGVNLNKIYDYFASGRPIIFAGKAPDDPISMSSAGYTIPPEDPVAMVKALESYRSLSIDERIALAQKAHCFARKNFDVKKLANDMEALLMETIGCAPN